MALFAYGTLVFPEVLMALLGRLPARAPASAPGWRIAALPGRVYPGLVPAPHVVAGGLVIGDLTPPEQRLLNAYEASEYRLTAIELADGRTCDAYVWQAGVLADDWDRAGFAADHLAACVERCARWRAATGW